MGHILDFTKRLYVFTGNKLIISILGMVLISLLEGTGIFLLLPIISISGIININVGVSPVSGIMGFLQKFPETLGLPLILCIYILIVVGQNVLQRILSIQDTRIQQNFLRHLRLETYRSLLQSNWLFFIKKRKSDLLNTLTSELTRVGFGTTMVLQLLASLIFTLIQISFAFWLSVEMTAFVLFFGILLTLFSRKFIRKSRSLGSQTSQLSQSLLAGLTDQLGGIKDIKSNMLEQSRMNWFQSVSQKMVHEQSEYIKLRSASQLFYKCSSAVLIALFIFLAVKFFHAQPEQLLLIIVIFSRIWPRFTGIQSNMEQIASTIPAFQALIDLQHECEEAKEVEEWDLNRSIKPMRIIRGIECQNVFFRYNQVEPAYALQDISFYIPANCMTAITGRSGAGKSTLVDIIMGLNQPEKGHVLIDGIPLTSENLLSFRRSISYVPQDPYLFNASIRENLLLIDPDASEEQIWDSLNFSASAEFVRKLPQGLDTLIGDRGIRLSGGERQRLVLARAILRKPSILVLDEATSALDADNETNIKEALDNIKGTMTIIVIAHRLSTIRNADQVIVLNQGEIIQRNEVKEQANNNLFGCS